MRRRHLIAALLLCAAAPLADDAPQSTPFGARFTAPKAWTLVPSPDRVVLTAPEGDLKLAVLGAVGSASAADAVASAWRRFDPAEHHRLKVTAPEAAREGWDEETVFEYETSPNEHLVLQAVAFRKDKAWTVLLVDGSESTAEKRAAAAGLVLQSMRPAGYARESFAGRTPHALDAARVETLKQFVAAGMTKLRIPGVAIALTDHGRLVYEGGLGVRALGRPDPVDAHTLFLIASNTKGLTTLMLAKLVDQGKLGWDQHVTEVYPQFRLGNDEVTRQVLIRHLICACTGIPRRDLEWLFNTRAGTPAADTFRQLAETVPTSKFGEVFQYSNLMASAAGYIGGHIAHPDEELGRAYDEAMQDLVFTPLGMTETTFDFAKARANPDHAAPHGDTIDGQQVAASMDLNAAVIPFRPAGAAWSSAADMIKYVDDELTEGRLPDGTTYISARNVLARRVANVPLGEDGSYGMGLMTDRRYGVTVIHHGGDLIGFHSDWFAITGAQVGAVILTNGDNGYALRGPFGRRLLEVLYDGKPDAQKELDANAAQIDAELAKERPYLTVPPDPAASGRLAPRYTNPSLGSITVRRQGPRVVFDFGAWRSEMASRKNDDGTLSFATIDPGEQGSAFVVGEAGGKRTLTIRDGQHVYIYTEG